MVNNIVFTTKNSFLKNIFTVFTGTFIAQLLPVLVSPLLSRFYAAEEFGLFTTFFSIVSILSVVITLRLELALPLPASINDVKTITSTAICTVFVFSITLLLAVIFVQHIVSKNFFNNQNQFVFGLILSVLLNGILQIAISYNGRLEAYKINSVARILNAVFANFIPLIVSFLFAKINGALIYAYIIGQFLAVLYMYFFSSYKWQFPGWQNIKNTYKANKQFPLYNAPTALLDQLGGMLSVLFFTSVFGLAQAGIYGMAMRVLVLPSAVIAVALSQVLFQTVVQKINLKQPVLPFIQKNAKWLLLIGILPFGFLILLAPQIFSLVFGNQWQLSGEYAQLLSIAGIIKFIVSPLSITLAATGGVKKLSAWQLLFFIENVGLIVVAKLFNWEAKTYLTFLVMADILMYSLYYYLIYSSAKKLDSKLSTKL